MEDILTRGRALARTLRAGSRDEQAETVSELVGAVAELRRQRDLLTQELGATVAREARS
ncbi:MAG: hypothetical protein Q8S73_36725 [Deltaproteobacteria bacterium]|nr:hypothetical protein [Myxococcales bacterium]MDP3219704.1 hypothetical protein [Deltaproteobacteria bacterium]